MIGLEYYRKELKEIILNDDYINKFDYDTALLYWRYIDNNKRYSRSKDSLRFSKVVNKLGIELHNSEYDKIDKVYISNIDSIIPSSINNMYNYADYYILYKSIEDDKIKYCYNEAMYIWLSKVIFSHLVLYDGEFEYYYIDYKSIKDLIYRDIVIFRNRMRTLNDLSLCPIRTESLWILDKYLINDTKKFDNECNRLVDYSNTYEDKEYILDKYNIKEIELTPEYIDSKIHYINNLIIKEILNNVYNKEI